MSGLSTTGSTVLTGLDQLPPSINLWRHALHWFGGIGIIVLAVAILPLLGVGGMQLYRAETPGPGQGREVDPRITETAKALWLVYSLITAVGIVALKLAGMNWLDAMCHTFSAMGWAASRPRLQRRLVQIPCRSSWSRVDVARGAEFRTSLRRNPPPDARALPRRPEARGSSCSWARASCSSPCCCTFPAPTRRSPHHCVTRPST